MGKSSSSQPHAPDPTQVAQQQSTANTNTAIANAWLNSPNIVTPYGNIATTQLGTHTVGGQQVPTFQQTQTLSPEQQHLYEQGVQGDTSLNHLGLDQLGRIKQSVSSPFSLDQFGKAPTIDAASRQHALDSIIGRNAPQMEADRASLEQRLAGQGISVGSEAYRNAMDQQQRGVNDFRLGADVQAGNEQAQQFGLESGNYQQQIANALLQRQQPLQEFSQFTGASNNFQSPSLVSNPGSMIQPTDVTSPIYANYQGQQNQYNQGVGQQNALIGAGAGLGASALGGWAMNW